MKNRTEKAKIFTSFHAHVLARNLQFSTHRFKMHTCEKEQKIAHLIEISYCEFLLGETEL